MNIQTSLDQVDKLISDINTLRPIDAEHEARVLEKFRLDWNYNSNAIEGNSLTFGETKAFLLHGITAKGKPFKDYLDIKGHDNVIEVLADLVRNKEELTEVLIRELHKILLIEPYVDKSMGPDGIMMSRRVEIGQYKSTANHVVTVTGKCHYFATPEETPAKMAQLVQWYRQERNKNELHPLVLAATFHHQFVNIHPFDDGNGRMARILMNLILMQRGYLPVVLKAERRNDYFLALAIADDGELADFITFVADAAVESATIFLKAARGEPIDELSDFDKKLRLLTLALEDGADLAASQRTQEVQNRIIRDFVVPLFSAVGSRFMHFEKAFGHRDLHLMWSCAGVLGSAKPGNLSLMLQKLPSATSDKLLDNVYLSYHARGFVKNAGKDFFCRLEIFFYPSSFVANLTLTGKQIGQIFKSDYSEVPAQIEAEQLAKAILAEIVQSFKKLSI